MTQTDIVSTFDFSDDLLLSRTDPLNRTTSYNYDSAGRVIAKTDRNGNTILYAYTPGDKVESIIYPNATRVNFIYNNLDQLISMQDGIGTTTYTYDAVTILEFKWLD